MGRHCDNVAESFHIYWVTLERFYLQDKVSDDTLIGQLIWKDIKDKVCGGVSYKNEGWYTELLEHQKRLIEDLRTIQEEIGLN